MRTSSRACWLSFVDWLGCGVSGVSPQTLRLTLGPVRGLLPLARQAALALGPWLLALLAEHQRAGRAAHSPEEESRAAEVLKQDTFVRPLMRREVGRAASWLAWLLEAELARLIRLAEAPSPLLARPGWLASEVRYWALVASLARVGQLYAELERRQGAEAAGRAWADAAARAWQQIGGGPQAA
ncbi:MAG TPA: hypothetical protein VFU69_13205 [Ktedonobacterales bacterium]|nr:hypothetical protein [Ktedonobacterales bacterium]